MHISSQKTLKKSYEKINNFSDQIPDTYLVSDLKKSDPVSDQTMF
jgi:hypothetical protein